MSREMITVCDWIISIFIVVYGFFCFFGFIIGWGIILANPKDGCTFHSIAARSNLGYIAACELFQERF